MNKRTIVLTAFFVFVAILVTNFYTRSTESLLLLSGGAIAGIFFFLGILVATTPWIPGVGITTRETENYSRQQLQTLFTAQQIQNAQSQDLRRDLRALISMVTRQAQREPLIDEEPEMLRGRDQFSWATTIAKENNHV